MSLTMHENTGSNFTPIEPGTYPAVCYGLVDLGEQYSETYDKWTPKVMVMWELPDEFIEVGGKQETRTISKTYTASISEKATLRKDLAAWRGRDFTPEELKGFDLKTIVGAPCMLNIIQRAGSNGKNYTDVAAIMKLPKNMGMSKGQQPKLIFDLDVDDLGELSKFPEWLFKRIAESKTYQDRVNASVNKDKADKIFDAIEGKTDDDPFDDDDVPF